MQKTLINRIASTLSAYHNCINSGNSEWEVKHRDALEAYTSELPSGSGVDNGSYVDVERSKPNRIVINTAFHHMNEAGFYDGWSEHVITITPDLVHGFTVSVSGRDRDGIKDYLADLFINALG